MRLANSPDSGPAHPVADGKDEVRLRERGLPGLAEVAHLVAVELEREERVLVVRAGSARRA